MKMSKSRLTQELDLSVILGGAFEIEDLVAIDAVEAMRVRANLALQIRDLPDGAEVIYKVC
jgi:hypothetical protein